MAQCNYNIQIEKNGKVFSFVIINLTTGKAVSLGEEKTRLEAARVANIRVLAMMKADKEMAAKIADDKSAAALVAALQKDAKEKTRIKAQVDAEKALEVIAASKNAPKTVKGVSKGWSAKRHADEEADELQCTNCDEILSFDDFYNDKTNVHGKQNHCKGCIKEHGKKRRAAAKAAKSKKTEDQEIVVLDELAKFSLGNNENVVQH